MPDLTPNLGLKKPLGNETVSRSAYNENLDIMDQNAAKAADLAAHLAETMPHRYQDIGTGATYQYGLKQQNNHLVFMYQEVV